jgi:hypothetical protein
LKAKPFDAQRISIEAGVNTRDALLGSNTKARETRIAQTRDKANAEARMQALLALQAQMDALDAEIAVLDGQIGALDELLAIFDSDEILDPNNPAHRSVLGRSGIPEEDWDGLTRQDIIDAKREREAERDAKQAERDHFEEIKQSGDPERIREAAEKLNALMVADNSRDVDQDVKPEIENTIEQRVDSGNSARQDATMSGIMDMDDDFFSSAPSDVSSQFNLAATGEDTAGPENTTDMNQKVFLAPSLPSGMA